MALNDYEAAAVRSWAVDHARRILPPNKSIYTDEVLDEAKKIEAYLTGRATAQLTSIKGAHGKRS